MEFQVGEPSDENREERSRLEAEARQAAIYGEKAFRKAAKVRAKALDAVKDVEALGVKKR